MTANTTTHAPLEISLDSMKLHLEGLNLQVEILEMPDSLDLVVQVWFHTVGGVLLGEMQWAKDGSVVVDDRNRTFSDYIDEGTLSLVQSLALTFLNHGVK